ncbi:MAG: beta-ketoacyl-ACP synthase III [Planctomycetota bacterium]
MSPRCRAQLVAVGSHLPQRVLTNRDLERFVDTSDAWITSRTGISERRIAEPGTPVSDLMVPAAQQCLERAGVAATQIDGIIVGTITPDHVLPASGNILQHKIGATRAWAMDLLNACNGFVASLATAVAYIESGHAERILVFGADVMSNLADYEDRETCILFGDGAGCVLVEAGDPDGPGVFGFEMHSDGAGAQSLVIPAGGSARPVDAEALAGRQQYLKQDGRAVFKAAIRCMAEVAESLIGRLGLTTADIDLLVPHQANRRIIEPTARRLGIGMDRVVVNLDRCANTTGATIPLALADAAADGRLVDGSRVLLVAFGGGYAWGACYLTWGRGA